MIFVGSGFDIHALKEGRTLILGGVEIPNNKGCVGHSDGDALIHAVIDSLLGACGLDDIGTFFPDTDPEYKDIDSVILLEKTGRILKEHNAQILNIDSTVILQSPKLSSFKMEMRQCIAKALGLDVQCVNVKAKTAERMLGELGSADAVCAFCNCLLER